METPKAFRITSKGFFLTYPRCELSKEHLLKALRFKRPAEKILVSRELHEDGAPHLHVYLLYGKEFDCRNERFFDVDGFHPNIQSAKSLKAVQAYVKKDGDYIQEGMDYAQETTAITSHRAQLAKRLLDGEPLTALVQDQPQLLFEYSKIKQNLQAYLADLAPVLPPCTGFIPNHFGLVLPVASYKNRHYWFWSSSPNKGKTTFLKSIQSQFPSLWYTWSEKYQSPAPGSQFVLLDEYSVGHLTITQLNMMCDGTYQYPVKGSAPFSLPSAIVLVCGNRCPLEIYDTKHHDLIKARFNVHCLDV